MNIPEMTVDELAEFRTTGTDHMLLDVREGKELLVAALPGALHIPMKDVPARTAELARDVPLVVMCHHGGRGAQITEFLHQNGFDNAVNLRGGIDAWSLAIDTALTRY